MRWCSLFQFIQSSVLMQSSCATYMFDGSQYMTCHQAEPELTQFLKRADWEYLPFIHLALLVYGWMIGSFEMEYQCVRFEPNLLLNMVDLVYTKHANEHKRLRRCKRLWINLCLPKSQFCKYGPISDRCCLRLCDSSTLDTNVKGNRWNREGFIWIPTQVHFGFTPPSGTAK